MARKMLGIDITDVSVTPKAEVGGVYEDVRGGTGSFTYKEVIDGNTFTREFSPDGEYKYVRAASAVAIGDAVRIDTGQTDEPAAVVPVSAADQPVEGIAIVSLASGSYGFIQVRGRVPSQAAATSVAALRYGAKMAAAGAAGDMKVSGASGNLASDGAIDVATLFARGRTILQLDAAIDDGSTTQFRGEVYIY